MVSLITTIAYGDIIGKNPYEEVLSLCKVGICGCSYGYLYDQLGAYS